MTSLRKEIFDLTYKWCVEANYETDIFIDELYKLFEKRIDSVNKIKPANVPEDVIYNCGYVDGIAKVKEILSKWHLH